MKNSETASVDPTHAFLSDLQALMADAEKLLSNSPESEHTENGSPLRMRLEAAQERFNELYAGAKKQVIAGGKYTDKTIRENPYQALAVAAVVGVLVGVLIGRRHS